MHLGDGVVVALLFLSLELAGPLLAGQPLLLRGRRQAQQLGPLAGVQVAL